MIGHPVLIPPLSSSSVQNVLPQIPKLKHVIYVDQKKISTEGYPAGLSIHSMQTVRELGALPQNSEYLSLVVPLFFPQIHRLTTSHMQYYTVTVFALQSGGQL